MVRVLISDVLRFSFEDIGEPSVMITGIILMPRLSASSWDIRKYQGVDLIITYEKIRFTHSKASLVIPSNDPLDTSIIPLILMYWLVCLSNHLCATGRKVCACESPLSLLTKHPDAHAGIFYSSLHQSWILTCTCMSSHALIQFEPRHEISNNVVCGTSKAQTSLRTRAVWSEPLLVSCVFYDC